MELVRFEKGAGILRVSLNRASALNAINGALLEELEQGLKKYGEDETVGSVMVFGQGGCFASGADIRELAGLDEEQGLGACHRCEEQIIVQFVRPNLHTGRSSTEEKGKGTDHNQKCAGEGRG